MTMMALHKHDDDKTITLTIYEGDEIKVAFTQTKQRLLSWINDEVLPFLQGNNVAKSDVSDRKEPKHDD